MGFCWMVGGVLGAGVDVGWKRREEIGVRD